MKLYILVADGAFYDAHESRETVERWKSGFEAKLRVGESPHRWFNRFVNPPKMQVVELDTKNGKVVG